METALRTTTELTKYETLQTVFKIGQDAFMHRIPWEEVPLKICEIDDGSSFFVGLCDIGYFEMTDEEQMFFMVMVIEFILNEFEPVDFQEYKDDRCREGFITGRNRLLYKGIIERVHQSGATSSKEDRKELYLFVPKVYAQLFKGIDGLFSYSDIAEQAEIIKQSDIVEKPLYYCEHDKENIQQIKDILQPSRFNNIMEIIGKGKHKASFTCLLYGPPGTGKTELVKQIARETHRDIFETSYAKLYSCFHGECEKNFTGLFRNYRNFRSITNEVPILLFNEADAVLMKRTTSMLQAIDKIENRIQNVLLQELEDFEGILIATTNMTCNVDPAFERRFLFKIHFDKPDEVTRKTIWKTVLPSLSDYEALHLASEYNLTGAGIDNVARKIEIYEAIHGCSPLMSTIINYCEAESINCTATQQDGEAT